MWTLPSEKSAPWSITRIISASSFTFTDWRMLWRILSRYWDAAGTCEAATYPTTVQPLPNGPEWFDSNSQWQCGGLRLGKPPQSDGKFQPSLIIGRSVVNDCWCPFKSYRKWSNDEIEYGCLLKCGWVTLLLQSGLWIWSKSILADRPNLETRKSKYRSEGEWALELRVMWTFRSKQFSFAVIFSLESKNFHV